jgi:glycerophosphoryl diester phosphodiesterase
MNRVLNIAHRGARSLAPENTLSAARKALSLGADLWETDVLVTWDGELVLLHDDTLARTTNVADRFPERTPWAVTAFTLAEVRSLDVGSWFVEHDPFGQIAAGAVTPGELLSFVCQSIPTLREALEFTRDAGWTINLELKPIPEPMDRFPVVERVLATIDDVGMDADQVIISSFHHDWLHEVRQRRPGMVVQALVGDLISAIRNPEFTTYNAWDLMVDEDQIRQAVGHNLVVNLFTVNDEDDMRRWIAAGVTGLFTDFPQRLRSVLAESR